MSKFELKDKIAIVTDGGGTAHGIGRCISLAYAKAGATVVVAGRHQESLDRVASEIEGLGRESLAVVTDVTVPDQIDNLVKETLDRFGRIDILANSFGASSSAKAEDITPDVWQDQIALNLNGTFFCCAAAGKVMIEQKRGRIVNMASASALKGEAMLPAYAAAKAGVINLTKSLALGWAQHNINVNCIAPGRVAVPDHPIEGMPDEEHARMKSAQGAGDDPLPLSLPGRPEDIANAAVFFASEGSDLITGETLVVRGSEWASVYF